ncbi:hypothetical protein HPB47_025833 [Ixodes persulcatus]|uniref:Uncharacterized protein n=1 Tax=Ixodes persulcatus TaxID=34615 RepID=A0AC60Q1T7_IXOPE|nr:hypothetical protein HPB47_025833 [Ixodes persulcatus]
MMVTYVCKQIPTTQDDSRPLNYPTKTSVVAAKAPSTLLLLEDFNCPHHNWGYDRTSAQGRKLDAFAAPPYSLEQYVHSDNPGHNPRKRDNPRPDMDTQRHECKLGQHWREPRTTWTLTFNSTFVSNGFPAGIPENDRAYALARASDPPGSPKRYNHTTPEKLAPPITRNEENVTGCFDTSGASHHPPPSSTEQKPGSFAEHRLTPYPEINTITTYRATPDSLRAR